VIPTGFPTVGEVLALDAVRRGRPEIVAGRRGLERRVRWVHVSELADIAGMLRGGELLLTTGVALPDDDAGLAAYIADLDAVGAAGLVVELGRRYRGTLSPALVRAAEGRALPLIALHRETPFVGITEAVHALIVDAQLAELRASERLHRTFTELTVEGADAGEIVRQTALIARRPIVLENLAHQVLAYDTAGSEAAELLDGWERRSRAAADGPSTATGLHGVVVGARGEDWGRLVLVLEPGSGPEPLEAMLLERSAAALALNRLVERDRESLERQTHRSVLHALLAHSQPMAEVAVRARALGVPLEGRTLQAVVLRRRGAEPAVLEAEQRLRALAEAAATAARAARLSALVGAIDDGAVGVLLASASPEAATAALEAFVGALGRSGAASPDDPSGHASPVVAAGTVVRTLADSRRSFLEAAQVADAAEHQPARPVYRLADVGLRGLLHLLRDDARLQTFIERELGPLLAHDAAAGTALVPMLRTYLDHGRNKSAAADAAHLSRPAFYERLAKIERILLVDLDSVDTCLSLHVALIGLDSVRRSS
jgi:purine catabolism regulator